jgi:hypothetical protein
MRGGTYAEAVKAGFTPEHARFMAHFGAELQGEIIEEIAKRQIAAESRNRAARRARAKNAAHYILPMLAGVIIGRLF